MTDDPFADLSLPDLDDSEPEMVLEFHIEDGELDHLSRAECFMLGVEYSTVGDLVARGDVFGIELHRENETRVLRLLEQAGASYTLQAMDDGAYLQVGEIEDD